MWLNRSLIARLSVFFTAVAALVVLGLGWLFMTAANKHFVELDAATLKDKAQLISDILAHAHSADDARWRIDEALSHHHGLYLEVVEAGGESLFRSPGYPVSASLAEYAHGAATAGQHHFFQTGQGDELRRLHFRLRPGYNPSVSLDATLALDTAHHRQFLADLSLSLTVYVVLATVISGVLGFLAAYQGLLPLRTMKVKAASITAQQLDGRMPESAVPIEMAELARELNRMFDRLQNDVKRLQDFSSDLAHELRTPIANLLTQSQVTLSSPRDATTYRQVLESNIEELERLARMVADMLFLAKTEQGVDLPHKERFAIGDEVAALIEFYEAVADEKTIKLVAVGNADLCGDRLMFRRALSNLLSNALTHADLGSDVIIDTQSSAEGVSVSVTNCGKAIPAAVLARLFDRFYRADPARSRPESDGAGLGLAITRAICMAHGGDASVVSANGVTRFVLSFPPPTSKDYKALTC